jgi:NhaP-type Na+/H+ or K+/H+ antiporter
MDPYIAMLAGFGTVVLATAWLPMLLRNLPLSLPIVCVAFGAALFWLLKDGGDAPSPLEHLELTERLTEFVVIVALMGAGLKLDRPLAWASAQITWRLLGVAMPLTIALIALLAWGLLGTGWAAAVLLGAALAPTDPVLASEVQVGPPGQGGEDNVRYSLTAEAGLNDGLAFPFVHLAIALALAGGSAGDWIGQWFAFDVAWKLTAGTVIGAAIGRGLGWVTFHLPERAQLSRTGDGLVALGITAVAYSVTEMASGYGFLAVFVAATAFRATERKHRYHATLHDFVEQIERLLLMILLVLFGGALSTGGLLQDPTWPVVLFALATVLIVRPLAAGLSLVGRAEPRGEKVLISFFGIRGVGSIYYLAFAAQHASFGNIDLVWSAASLVILVSIVLHGATATPVMRALDRQRRRAAALGKTVVLAEER